jgi:hypothetical protein
MTKDEALKLALHGLEMGVTLIEDFGSKEQLNTQHKAIAAIYEVYEKAKQNSVIGVQYVQGIPFFPPPQRTWVGLTNVDIQQMGLKNYIKVVRETEAKLKELNS